MGTKGGKIMTGCYGMNPTLLPTSLMADFKQPEPTIPRVKGETEIFGLPMPTNRTG